MTRSGSSSLDEGEIVEHDSYTRKRHPHDSHQRTQKRRRNSSRSDRRRHRVVFELGINHITSHHNSKESQKYSLTSSSLIPSELHPNEEKGIQSNSQKLKVESGPCESVDIESVPTPHTESELKAADKEPPLDEDALIEKRRLRREAILAKYKITPASPLESATFSLAKPAAQLENVDAEDGPSAADYDPINDRKLDEKHREEKEIPPQPNVPEPSNDNVDMFADDDMFADAPLPPPICIQPKPALPQPLQLNERLLDNWDDPEGYYRVIMGELMDGRYMVNANLGKGMFSTVIKATENVTGKQYAIKIVRNNESMRKAGMKEIGILKKLMEADPDDRKHVIRMERYFDHKSHLCIVFESLSINLREVLKKFGRDVGINLKAVRIYAQQMFLGLSLFRKCNILHADIKPDNILVNEARNVLKVCDLGSASDASENEITPYLVSRFYRAPEIILGIPYDFSLDVWSIGCTLYELYSGKILFPGRSNNQMLRLIMECRGRFNNKFLKRGEFTHLHFDQQFNFKSSEIDRHTGKALVKTINFSKPVKDLKSKLMGPNTTDLAPQDLKLLNNFVDFLDRCLNLLPEKRITPKEALVHPFIRG